VASFQKIKDFIPYSNGSSFSNNRKLQNALIQKPADEIRNQPNQIKINWFLFRISNRDQLKKRPKICQIK